jgi:hypothetical protein
MVALYKIAAFNKVDCLGNKLTWNKIINPAQPPQQLRDRLFNPNPKKWLLILDTPEHVDA